MKIRKYKKTQIIKFVKDILEQKKVGDKETLTLFPPTSVESILTDFQEKIAKLNLDAITVPSAIKCWHCDQVNKFKDNQIYDVQYYVPPSGCTDGDYYRTTNYSVLCSSCNTELQFNKEVYYKILEKGENYEISVDNMRRKCSNCINKPAKIIYKKIYQ